MFKLRSWIRSFFGFSRSQINGFLVLLPLMILIIFSAPVYRSFFFHHEEDRLHDRIKMDSIIAHWSVKKEELFSSDASLPGSIVTRKKAFDPNTVSEQELQALGFSGKLAKRIINYREKGGVFKVKHDLLKIYGMDSSFYSGLHHLITLPDKSPKKANVIRESTPFKPYRKPESSERFDLNRADTAQLKTLKGIGDKLAQRIIRYRDALGGFVAMEQTKEVYGLDSMVVNTLVENSFVHAAFMPRKIDVNNLSAQQLSAHPYLSRSMAEAMVTYRFQHGKFRSLEDLRKIRILAPETIQRIGPYVEFGD